MPYVTGVSRLTGQWEVLTPPCFYATAKEIRDGEMQKAARKRVYLRLRIEAVGNNFFEQLTI